MQDTRSSSWRQRTLFQELGVPSQVGVDHVSAQYHKVLRSEQDAYSLRCAP
jgi:hypothetical protein